MFSISFEKQSRGLGNFLFFCMHPLAHKLHAYIYYTILSTYYNMLKGIRPNDIMHNHKNIKKTIIENDIYDNNKLH